MKLGKLMNFAMRSRSSAPPRPHRSRQAPWLQDMRQGGWMAGGYSDLAQAGYAGNPIANRAIRMICESAASVPALLHEGPVEHRTHPLLELLARPNAGQSGATFLEEVYGYLLVSGNAYVECVHFDGAPRELYALRPDRVRLTLDAQGWPESYQYRIGASERAYPAEADPQTGLASILHLKIFHPLDDHYGFAPLGAARASLEIHNATSAWNRALLDNAAQPSGALVYKGPEGTRLSDAQYERLRQELDTGYQGMRNAGRPMLLEGGLEWQQMSLSPREMDFISAKNQAAREIALAFGVPTMLLGIPGDNTYSNYQEANRAFWRQAILPLVARTFASVANWLGAAYGGNFRLEPNLDKVPALAQERGALWSRIDKASFLTRDEKRAAVGYGVDDAKAEPPPQTPAAGKGAGA